MVAAGNSLALSRGIQEVQVVPLSEKALSAEDWLLHQFCVYHLVGRSGSLNTLSSEDLILVSTLHQGIRLNFRHFMMERIHFMVDRILRQKVISSKRSIGLPYGMSICRLLECLDIQTGIISTSSSREAIGSCVSASSPFLPTSRHLGLCSNTDQSADCKCQ